MEILFWVSLLGIGVLILLKLLQLFIFLIIYWIIKPVMHFMAENHSNWLPFNDIVIGSAVKKKRAYLTLKWIDESDRLQKKIDQRATNDIDFSDKEFLKSAELNEDNIHFFEYKLIKGSGSLRKSKTVSEDKRWYWLPKPV